MMYSIFLWLLVWGGMFTGWHKVYYYLANASNPAITTMQIFQAARAFSPLLAIFLCFLWYLKDRSKFPFAKDPLGFFFLYGLLGMLTSFFLSVSQDFALYNAAIFLAPLFVIWCVHDNENYRTILRNVIYANYAIFFFLTFALLPSAYRIGRGFASFTTVYDLPFGFGQVNRNGVGRYALIVIIVSAVRILTDQRRRRYVWVVPMIPALFLLAQTQSRTSLLGLAIASVLFIILRGMNWRFLFAGPVVAFILFTAGYQVRAGGRLDALLSLTGREATWIKSWDMIKESPYLGWGFYADRLMFRGEHVHNSYLHALLQVGVVGALFFLAAILSFWFIMFRSNIFRQCRELRGSDQAVLMEAIMIVGFLTSRTFFESTAAFYGVDLLLIIPAMAFISLFTGRTPGGVGLPTEAA
jgi:hypothetical protein